MAVPAGQEEAGVAGTEEGGCGGEEEQATGQVTHGRGEPRGGGPVEPVERVGAMASTLR